MTYDNPHPPGTPEAEEYRAIVERLADPAAERRHARALADAEAPTGPADPEVHAELARRLTTVGVILGPDCSQFQGAVDWQRIASSGCRIFGYKVSEGRTYEDPQHARSKAAVRALQQAGRGVGVGYHFLFGSAEYAANPALWATQADFFCSLVDPDVVHVCDAEAAQPPPGLGVDRWAAAYFRHFPTKTLLVYSNKSLYTLRSHVSTGPPPGRVQTWHAGVGNGYYTAAGGTLAQQWDATGSLHDSMAEVGFPPAELWQFTDHAIVPGVSGTCDGNAWRRPESELLALATGASDTMSQADQDAINAHTDQALKAAVTAVWSATFGKNPDGTPRTAAQMLSEASTADNVLAELRTNDAALQAAVDTLNTKIGSGSGGTLTKADLLEALGAVRLTTDAKPPA